MPDLKYRETYNGAKCLIPAIIAAGWDRYQRAGTLGPHVHDTAFEVCLIVSGAVDWWVANEVHQVRGGEIYITRPQEPHGGVDAVMHPCELFWFQIVLDRQHPLAGMTTRESNMLHQRLLTLTRRSFKASSQTMSNCRHLLNQHKRPDAMAPLSARITLQALIIGLLRDHDAEIGREQTLCDAVKNARKYMLENLHHPFRIADAAHAAGISVARLHARFASEIGQTPAAWRLRQLVGQAKTALITTDTSITDIAMQLGFSSSQYFATAFKRVTGMSPAAYRHNGL